MTDVIQPASSARAKCRGCGLRIASGELRFGESLPNPYAEGEALYWFHLVCAACMRPEKLLPALAASSEAIADREWLRSAAELSVANRRLPRLARAERSKSGKARCRSCRELIAAGGWRLALQMFDEGRMSPIGYVHVECAEAYLGTASILDRIRKLTPDLDDAGATELSGQLAQQRVLEVADGDASPAAADGEGSSAEPAGPQLAKTRPVLEPAKKRVSEP